MYGDPVTGPDGERSFGGQDRPLWWRSRRPGDPWVVCSVPRPLSTTLTLLSLTPLPVDTGG